MQKQLSDFTLEMNNREVSFNKIFNNVPMVGVLHPSKAKDYKTKALSKKMSHQKLPPLSLLTTQERSKSASTMG